MKWAAGDLELTAELRVKIQAFSRVFGITVIERDHPKLKPFVQTTFRMGSGASVEVHQPHVSDAHFKTLLSSKAARKELFEDISAFKSDDHITLKGKISLKKLVGYFSDQTHALYPGFFVNVDVLSEAYKFSTEVASYPILFRAKLRMDPAMLSYRPGPSWQA